MLLATIAQSQEIDRSTSRQDPRGDGEASMEAAGALSAQQIRRSFFAELRQGTVALFCGTGNNGADGLVVARHLLSFGYKRIRVYILPGTKTSSLFELQRQRLKQGLFEVDIKKIPHLNENFLHEMKAECSLLIDALSGLGLRAPLKVELKSLISFLNNTKVPIVSLDLPTGLDADRGNIFEVCIRAQMTLTLGLAKPGFFINEGPVFVGRLRILPVGYAPALIKDLASTHSALTLPQVQRLLPRRKIDANKANQGHTLVCAGHEGFWGAGLLSSQAAFRAGSGYVTLASWKMPDIAAVVQEPSVMTRSIADALKNLDKYKAIAVGPGLGIETQTLKLVEHLKKRKVKNVILDADALSACAAQPSIFPLPDTWILTPHAGELSKLLKSIGLDISSEEIEQDRFRWANEAVKKIGGLVLLKGFRTVVSNGKKSYVILSGHPALAKAGTGDVLTGFIGGFLAQGMSPLRAAGVGAFVHGRLAQEWIRDGKDATSLVSSDLGDLLPPLLHRLRTESHD